MGGYWGIEFDEQRIHDAHRALLIKEAKIKAELIEALEMALRPHAIQCCYSAPANNPGGLCCLCGAPQSYHWKPYATEALARASE